MKACEAAAESSSSISSSSSFAWVQKIQRTWFCAELKLGDQICSSQGHKPTTSQNSSEHTSVCAAVSLQNDITSWRMVSFRNWMDFNKDQHWGQRKWKQYSQERRNWWLKETVSLYWWENIQTFTFIRWFRREEHTLNVVHYIDGIFRQLTIVWGVMTALPYTPAPGPQGPNYSNNWGKTLEITEYFWLIWIKWIKII